MTDYSKIIVAKGFKDIDPFEFTDKEAVQYNGPPHLSRPRKWLHVGGKRVGYIVANPDGTRIHAANDDLIDTIADNDAAKIAHALQRLKSRELANGGSPGAAVSDERLKPSGKTNGGGDPSPTTNEDPDLQGEAAHKDDQSSPPPGLHDKPSPSPAIPETIADTLTLRLRLLENGFEPAIVSGKIPAMNGWQRLPLTAESLQEWTYKHPSATNTGARSKNAPALDIDITHQEAAEAVEALARQHFAGRGEIHVRIGLPPKRLIPLRTDAPFRKLTCVFAAPIGADGKPPKIEILGDGQQYVVNGIHPDTHKPYRWTNGAGDMDVCDIRRDNLPPVTVEDCEAFLADAAKLLVEQFGFVEKQTKASGGGSDGKAQAGLERIARAFRVIPNDDADWDDWCLKGLACYRATDGSEAGYEIWREWSAKSQKHSELTTFEKWHNKFKGCPPHSVDVGSIFFWANEVDPNWDEKHTDLGNERRIVRLHGNNIRYVAAWKSWLVWRDGHWRRDDDGEIMRLAKATVEGMFGEATAIADEAVRNAQRKYALKCQGAQRLVAMVELAKTERAVILPVSMIDTDPLLLGVENGVIDLRTGVFRPAEREDYVTKRCGVAFDPSATCPNWDAFLQRIFLNIQALIAYVQRACGYTLTGLTDEEVMFILWATGANGKSTLRETIFALMGDYAMGADASLLIAHKKQQGGPTPDVARMFGKRMVTVNETQEGDHLNESRVKFITSHDVTTARFLFENFFDFTPTHKNWLTTNKKPIVKGTDPGIWRRVQMWPFLFTIPEKERDRYFRQKWLMPELPGILNWALAGLMSYHKQGLAPPPAIIAATEEYRKDMDVLGQWITARLVPDPESRLKRTDLFRDYEIWSKANIGWHMTSIAFGRELAARKETLGLTEVHIDHERGWRGIALCSATATLAFPLSSRKMTKTLRFGKYKGHTIAEVLAGDPEYLRWLCSQDEFRSSRRVLYQDLIDCAEGLADAPERKVMRARFQDENFCRRFLRASGHEAILLQALEARHACALEGITDRLRSLKEATDGAKNYIDDPSHQAWAREAGIFLNPVDRERQLAGFEQLNTALQGLRKRLPNQLEGACAKVSCRFEQHGFDVIIRAALRYPWGEVLRKNYLGSHDDTIRSTVAVKMRWAADYHATVRWIGGNRNVSSGMDRRSSTVADHVVLLVGRYSENSTAKERLVGELAAADIKAVFAVDLEIQPQQGGG